MQNQDAANRTAFLGERGSFSSIAALKLAGNAGELSAQQDLPAVVGGVIDDGQPTISSGVLPIENNVAGFVGETLDLLLTNDILVVSSVALPISFTAYYLPGVDIATAKFEVLRAHPHALSQCAQFARQQNLTPLASLSASAAITDLDEKSLALAPTHSPEFSDYKIFARDVQDYTNGKTQFVKIVKHKPLLITENTTKFDLSPLSNFVKKILVVLIPKKNKVGALYEILGEISRGSINITSLISRPIKGVDNSYSFFLTLESQLDDNFVNVLRKVYQNGNFVRILGGYVDDSE